MEKNEKAPSQNHRLSIPTKFRSKERKKKHPVHQRSSRIPEEKKNCFIFTPLRIPRDKEDSIRVKKNKKKYPRGILVLTRRASEAASTPPPSLTILRDRAIVCGQMAQKKEGCGEKKGGKEVKVKEGEGARKLVLRKGKGREGRLARERPKSVGRALRCRAGGDESRLAFRERETQ